MSFGVKICLLGDGGVGKTSIRKRYLGHNFQATYIETIGADFAKKIITIDNTELILQIWDLAGQTRYDSVRALYYTGVRGALIVFDVSRPESLHNVTKWVQELLNHSVKAIPIVLIGNKIDLLQKIDDSTQVKIKNVIQDIKMSLHLPDSLPVYSIITSAKTGQNISEAFQLLGKSLLANLNR